MKASETGSIVKSPVAKRPSGRSAKPVCLSAEGTRKRGNFSDRKRWGAQTLTERKRPRARRPTGIDAVAEARTRMRRQRSVEGERSTARGDQGKRESASY